MKPDELQGLANRMRREFPKTAKILDAAADAWQAEIDRRLNCEMAIREKEAIIEALERLMQRFVDENSGHSKCYECGAEEQESHDGDCLVGLCVASLAGKE